MGSRNPDDYMGILLKNVSVFNIKEEPLIKKWSDEGKIVYDDFTCDAGDLKPEDMALDAFSCTLI